jgi:hypothetical protein
MLDMAKSGFSAVQRPKSDTFPGPNELKQPVLKVIET